MVYLISEILRRSIEKIQNIGDINSAGLYFGFISKNAFFLSLEGAEFLLKEKLIPNHNILCVNNKGEKAILYGNQIKKEMVSQIPSDIQKNDFLFVLNGLKELIALGRSEINYSQFEFTNQEKIIARNFIDKGYYLRRKQ